MKMKLVTLRKAASFRNQTHLIQKAAIKAGYAVDSMSIEETTGPPKGKYDKLLACIPLWPRYLYDMTRQIAPWMSRQHIIYGPVDGPLRPNDNLFRLMANMNIVVPSYWCRDMLARNHVAVKAVVHHGIDHTEFDFSDTTHYTRLARLRQKYPRKTIFFSNINPLHRKGLVELKQAIELLHKKVGDTFIFILHTGLAAAVAKAKRLDRTPNLVIEDAYNKLPFRAIAEKTAACDVFVHPSKLEGFGLTVLEAAAAKKAIVCVDTGPLNEIVGPKQAWLFPFTHIKEEEWANGSIAQLHEYNPSDLAATMEAAMLNKQASQEKAEAAYEKSKAFDYRKVYGKLVKM